MEGRVDSKDAFFGSHPCPSPLPNRHISLASTSVADECQSVANPFKIFPSTYRKRLGDGVRRIAKGATVTKEMYFDRLCVSHSCNPFELQI